MNEVAIFWLVLAGGDIVLYICVGSWGLEMDYLLGIRSSILESNDLSVD